MALRPSITRDYLGLPEILFSDKSHTQIKYSIEKIYREWSDEKCKASRISKLIRDEDSWPAIIIQPKIDDVQTMVSRSARTGRRVSSDDLYNVDIKVTELGPAQVELATKAENILSRPVKVQFVSLDGLLQVVGVSEQVMSDKARFAAFQDLLTCGVADEIDLILSVRIRDMIVYSSFDEEAYGEGEFACGIAGSPGVARGQIGFRTTELDEFSARPILLIVDDVGPEDSVFVHYCCAALTTKGGKASHVAVWCRSWGKPCVVGVDAVSIDEKKRELIFLGSRYPEFTEFVISGNSGRLYIVGDIRSGYKCQKGYEDFIPKLVEVVSRIMCSGKLATRDIDDQKRVAETIYLLRELKAIA